ncbi:serine hydroxymethyltransferase 7-like [Gastrolobium bilobum]|uniref:serine hydroxymethyltransferase 7-like n=1 Tax=Gastrolobium bilobum TaxID=150636 RepID=UPI002AB11FFC|nr:serine hydroxymethyltransferase 7-like [Gastrolobium bilobum]
MFRSDCSSKLSNMKKKKKKKRDSLRSVYLSNKPLVAVKEVGIPFDYCDIVTSTTHKSLRGPGGGIIFYRRGTKPRKQRMVLNRGDDSTYDFEEKTNFALYPSLQGGPHNNHIAALAIALKQVKTPEYKVYMQQVKENANALASALLNRKCRLGTDETDNHLLLWVLTTLRLIGTPAMASRGYSEDDFETIADSLFRAALLTCTVQREHAKSLEDFLRSLQNNKDIIELRDGVETCASRVCNARIQYLI